MEFLPTLLCLLAAAQARNIIQPEVQEAPEGTYCHCDRRFLRHYEVRGCVAEALDSCGCPTKFNCPPTSTNGSLEVCFYRGKEYAPGSRIRTPNACQVCRCQEGTPPRLSCVTRECPELTAPEGNNCHLVYAENRCCPLRYECLGNEIEDAAAPTADSKTCSHEGRVYPFGAKIQAADDPCLVCTCDEGWEENRTCAELDCVMEKNQHRLDEGCVPVYHEGRCCPIEFYCPSLNASLSELPVPEETNATSDDGCSFGGRFYGRGEELIVGDEHPCVQCACAVPPHPTCVHRTCPPPPVPDCGRNYRPGQCCPEYECMLGDGPAEEEGCPTPICEHANCRVAVPPGKKCLTCICGEMVSELEHNNLEQRVEPQLQQQVAQNMEEMAPPSQFLTGETDDSSEGGLQLMPLVMERSVQELGKDSFEEESDKEVNEGDVDEGKGFPELDLEEMRGNRNGSLIINEIWSIDHEIEESGKEMKGREVDERGRGKRNAVFLPLAAPRNVVQYRTQYAQFNLMKQTNGLSSVVRPVGRQQNVPEGCPTPMCEGNWCKILIPEGHNCPTCVCKRFDMDTEP